MINLIRDKWIPIIRKNGVRELIAPWEVAEADNPVVEIDAPRPDFQGGLYQFLIGLLQTTFAPQDYDDWLEVWQDGVDLAQVQGAFNVVENAFYLHPSDGPAFLQDFDLPNDVGKPIAALLIESPGEKTIKDNLDHFIKRNLNEQMCPSCAASALLTLQLNAPAGGSGHRVGLRGGGPLTTLVKPDFANATLWQMLWLNVLDKESFEYEQSDIDEQIFPWLGPTRLSGKTGDITTPDDVHPLQMYWGMPRRVRLQTVIEEGECDTCGMQAKYYFKEFRARNYGVNYDGRWIHPLTPYRFDPKKSDSLPLSLKGQQGGLSYRHWTGLVLQDKNNGDSCAKIVATYMDQRARAISKQQKANLWCFGFDMDNMKARCWYDHHMPLFQLDAVRRKTLLIWANELVYVAKEACTILKKHIKEAWFNRPGDVKGDMQYIDAEFWQDTDNDFNHQLVKLATLPSNTQFPTDVYQQWPKQVFKYLEASFERWCLERPPGEVELKRIVRAKKQMAIKYWSNKAVKDMKQQGQPNEIKTIQVN